MKAISSLRMRELDVLMTREFGVPGDVLMDRAGTGVAEVVQSLARISGYPDPSVLLIAGRGNNGGDAFVAARRLKDAGLENVAVWLVGSAGEIGGDAQKHLSRMKAAGLELRELPTIEDWEDAIEPELGCDIIVDGVLGTGITGPARGPAAVAIRFINDLSERSLIVSIDIPSGLNSDTGEAAGGAVRADITATMGLPKTGLLEPCALEFVGTLEVVDLGMPDELLERVESPWNLITAEDLRTVIPRRARISHKGTFGHLLIVGGAAGYSGAVALAAGAALRSGVGLVTVLTPGHVAGIVAGLVPEAMVHGAGGDDCGLLQAASLTALNHDINDYTAILIGPGMTASEESRLLVERLLSLCRVPLVMDADALNVCGAQPGMINKAACPVIVTPHPGELGRLLGCSVAAVQADRFGMAARAAEAMGATVVLKGAGTIVAERQRSLDINLTGNPGMATGGMGDVLAGLLAGLAACGIAPRDAACTAVYLHGRAADNVAWKSSQAGMTAGDVVRELPFVFRELAVR